MPDHAPRNPRRTNGVRRPVYRGVADSAFREPNLEIERLPKESTGHGLTIMLLPRNFEEEEKQHEETAKMLWQSHGLGGADDQGDGKLAGQAGPTSRGIGMSQTRSGVGPRFENITRLAGRGLGQARSAPPGSTPPPRVGPTRKKTLDFI